MSEPIVGVQYAEYTSDGTELPSVSIALQRQEPGLVLAVDAFNMLGKPDVVRMLKSVIIALEDTTEEPEERPLMEPTHMPFNPQPRQPGGR